MLEEWIKFWLFQIYQKNDSPILSKISNQFQHKKNWNSINFYRLKMTIFSAIWTQFQKIYFWWLKLNQNPIQNYFSVTLNFHIFISIACSYIKWISLRCQIQYRIKHQTWDNSAKNWLKLSTLLLLDTATKKSCSIWIQIQNYLFITWRVNILDKFIKIKIMNSFVWKTLFW